MKLRRAGRSTHHHGLTAPFGQQLPRHVVEGRREQQVATLEATRWQPESPLLSQRSGTAKSHFAVLVFCREDAAVIAPVE